MRKSALITASAFIGLASLVAGGTAASASSAPAPKVAGASSFTLNLLGAPITVGVTTGVDGSLTNVNVDPTVLVATAARINKVSFSNVAGTASVTVRANHGGQSVAIRSTSLADLAGIANGWTGDVFGNDVKSSVTFDVVDNVGSPELANVRCAPGAGITCSLPVTTSGHDDDDDDGSSVSSSVTFTSETGATRTLRIRVGMHTDDGNTQAVVRISLSRITEPAITGVGLHTWTGVLCDGTPATIKYDVADGGAVTVTEDPLFTVKGHERDGVKVMFASGEQVRISARGTGVTAQVRLEVRLRCPQDLPTINSIAPDPSIVSGDDDGDDDHGDHSDDDDGDDHGSDHGGGRGGNGGSDDVKGHG
ncbi:MAG: hypothetical protein NTX77_06900 [Actinobacteria bacterium]|nr:hypothetical protein [Actinomycetota bacterium]